MCKMRFERAAGVLLHLTSLPSPDGIGDLGKGAYEFVDFLARTKQKIWQILPLTPVGYGESPYQSLSAFAGNSLLLSLEMLAEEGLLLPEELRGRPNFSREVVNFPQVKVWKKSLLKKASQRFRARSKRPEYKEFLEENQIWLDNYAFFMALKEYFQGLPWNEWEEEIAFREKKALGYYHSILQEKIEEHYFLQFAFSQQWQQLKAYAQSQGIMIMGDLPIFVSYDSSDAWANPHLFELDNLGNPIKVAGVPPDYFSQTGQLWGNPHYKWQEMAKNDYFWWRERISHLLKMVDIIRIDHFRGFEAYWEISGGAETAAQGKWVKGPGAEFFQLIKKYLGELPIVAEDLGIITPEVEQLKNSFDFPGMKVLQFSFNSRQDRRNFLCNLEENTVVYTGTHDNDTLLGWYKKLGKENSPVQKFFRRFFYFNSKTKDPEICWQLIAVTLHTPANLAIIPLQDILALGSEGRMNLPGTVLGNWQWRLNPDWLMEEQENKLRELVIASGRSKNI